MEKVNNLEDRTTNTSVNIAGTITLENEAKEELNER